jgi:hypothetical protein
MFKLKLTQPGYENFTGRIAQMDFADGTSVMAHSPETCGGIANVLQCDRVEVINGTDTDTGIDDTTDPTNKVRDNTGDPDVANQQAPTDPV